LRLIQERLKSRRVTQIWFGNKRREGCPGLIQWLFPDYFMLWTTSDLFQPPWAPNQQNHEIVDDLRDAAMQPRRFDVFGRHTAAEICIRQASKLRKTQAQLDTCAVKIIVGKVQLHFEICRCGSCKLRLSFRCRFGRLKWKNWHKLHCETRRKFRSTRNCATARTNLCCVTSCFRSQGPDIRFVIGRWIGSSSRSSSCTLIDN
jgi:hypothetical protein